MSSGVNLGQKNFIDDKDRTGDRFSAFFQKKTIYILDSIWLLGFQGCLD